MAALSFVTDFVIYYFTDLKCIPESLESDGTRKQARTVNVSTDINRSANISREFGIQKSTTSFHVQLEILKSQIYSQELYIMWYIYIVHMYIWRAIG